MTVSAWTLPARRPTQATLLIANRKKFSLISTPGTALGGVKDRSNVIHRHLFPLKQNSGHRFVDASKSFMEHRLAPERAYLLIALAHGESRHVRNADTDTDRCSGSEAGALVNDVRRWRAICIAALEPPRGSSRVQSWVPSHRWLRSSGSLRPYRRRSKGQPPSDAAVMVCRAAQPV